MTLEPSSWSITVNGTDTGRVFEGIGAISGGGATSRLLLEYPPDQRKDILDYLFRPNFGAGFQHLKVEIGGDVFSSEGTEPSYAHTREEFLNPTAGTFNRGYEWRIMEEAKARNPDIKFSALEWGAPGWIGTGSSDREKFYSQDNIDYIIQFVNGAHDYHDLTIDYVGTWNEVAHDVPWIKHLRTAVDGNNAAHGYATKIIAADSGDWSIADDMAQDPDLASAVDVVGVHYPWFDSNPPYGSTQVARDLGKPLWASEDGVYVLGPWSGNWESTKELARIYNRNYAVGRMTQTTLWNLVTSYYDNLPLPDAGPLKANSPWSGHYDVGPGVWVTAHTTQFAQPGWQYLDSATGLSYDPSGSPTGSYVTLKSPNNTDYSVIVETTQATSRAAVTFHITGGLSAGTVHVWRTNQTSSFVQLSDITPGPDGTFSLTLDPESIYSLTTTAGQQKGTASASIPPAASFPFPYADDFEAYGLGQMARYLSDQGGSFEVALPAAGTGQVYRQVVPSRGIEWAPPNGWLTPDPYTLLGDGQWSDYRVSVSAYIGSAASPTAYMAVLGRIHSVPGSITFRPWPDAYELYLDRTGLWKLERTRFTPGTPESYEIIDLAAGEIAGFDPTAWHQLALDFRGTTITALVDGAEVGQVTDTTYGQGMAGFGSGWHVAEFDSFSVS